MSIVEFLNLDILVVPREMPITYLILLFAYVAKKEVKRWMKQIRRRRKGEFFFWAWSLLIFFMHIVNSLSHDLYRIPYGTMQTFCYVLLLYSGSEFSKHIAKKQRAKRFKKSLNSKT